MLKIGDKAIDFILPDHLGEEVSLNQFSGKWIILYFYPRDNTPGCTLEAIDFSILKEEFERFNTVILGISRDSITSHKNFVEKKELTIKLLSNPDHEVIEKYGAWQLKKLYGRESFGIIRSTFLINAQGIISYVWPKVKARGHAVNVMQKLIELQ